MEKEFDELLERLEGEFKNTDELLATIKEWQVTQPKKKVPLILDYISVLQCTDIVTVERIK